MAAKTFKKILWSINPFDQAPGVQRNVRHVLTELASSTGATIEPVHVASFPASFHQKMYSKTDFQALLQDGLDSQLKKFKIPHLLPAKILIQEEQSISHAIRLLNQYAERSVADAILVATHGRKGTARFFLGSFAETLLQKAELPVISVCPKTDLTHPIKHILFATDFEESSLAAYKNAINLATQLHARITILNIFQPGESYLLPYGSFGVADINAAWVPAPEDIEEIHQSKAIELEDWAELGRKKGITTHAKVSRSEGNIAEDIMHYAEHHRIDLIAMAAHSGVLRGTIFGSVTRQVVRSATCPVWVMRT